MFNPTGTEKMNETIDTKAIFHNLTQTNLIQIGMIIAGAFLLIMLSQRSLPWIAKRFSGRSRIILQALVPTLRLLIIIIAVALIIPRLIEPTVENLVTLLGALGLALGFAFKDYASSLIAGVVTLYEMPYRPEDWIEVDGTYGKVRAINMRTAEIVTPDDTVVTIPHLKLWNQMIFNANDGTRYLQCVTDFYLDFHHDATTVKDILHDVALTSVFLEIEKPIRVIISDKPWGTHYRLKAYPIEPCHQFAFITDLTVRGKAALIGLGVEFAAVPSIAGNA
jgi:small-conductance mechanosensitive channel